MSSYYNILTNLGRSKITELVTSQSALGAVSIAFGDGNGSVPTPTSSRTSLVNEVHRRPADKLQRHPTLTNSIIVDVVIPASVGGFWIREFGIFYDGVMICNGSLAPTFKEISEDSVNTYRLKPYINIETDRLQVVEVESNLIYATEGWTEDNFIQRTEIIDNLITDDPDKVASARTVKELQDKKLESSDLEDASTTQKGVVQLIDDLTTGGVNKALTAEMGKILNDQAFGVGQKWHDVTSQRLNLTTYTNNTGKTIAAMVTVTDGGSGQGLRFYVDNFDIVAGTNIPQGSNSITAIIPDESEYSIDKRDSSHTITKWSELR